MHQHGLEQRARPVVAFALDGVTGQARPRQDAQRAARGETLDEGQAIIVGGHATRDDADDVAPGDQLARAILSACVDAGARDLGAQHDELQLLAQVLRHRRDRSAAGRRCLSLRDDGGWRCRVVLLRGDSSGRR